MRQACLPICLLACLSLTCLCTCLRLTPPHLTGGGGGTWNDKRKKGEKINIENRRKARLTRRDERAEEREANKVTAGCSI
jgi:hypothetical protein